MDVQRGRKSFDFEKPHEKTCAAVKHFEPISNKI